MRFISQLGRFPEDFLRERTRLPFTLSLYLLHLSLSLISPSLSISLLLPFSLSLSFSLMYLMDVFVLVLQWLKLKSQNQINARFREGWKINGYKSLMFYYVYPKSAYGSFHVKSHTQKMNHFRLFSYLVHKVYILWDFIILNISLLWLLVLEKEDVQIPSISKNKPTSIGHNLFVYQSFFFYFFLRVSLIPVQWLKKSCLTHLPHMITSNVNYKFCAFFQYFWNLTMSCSWAGIEIFEYEPEWKHLDVSKN